MQESTCGGKACGGGLAKRMPGRGLRMLLVTSVVATWGGCATFQVPRPPSGKGWGTTAQGSTRTTVTANGSGSARQVDVQGKVTTVILNPGVDERDSDPILQVLQVGKNVKDYDFSGPDAREVSR